MVLKVHNLSLPLKETTTGPLLEIEDEFLAPLEWIVNSAVIGEMPQLADCLARGEDAFVEELYATRPMPDEDLSESRARWQKLTGVLPSEDVYVLGTSFTYHEVVLPRQTLLEIISNLLKLRAPYPKLPFPWLFRLNPYHLTPAKGEEELVRKLEERAVAFKALLARQTFDAAFHAQRQELLRDYEEAGLFSEAYSEEKQYWLELWGLPTLLAYHRAALAFLNHFRYTALRVEKPLVVSNDLSPQTNSAQVLSHSPASTTTNGAKVEFALGASINTAPASLPNVLKSPHTQPDYVQAAA